MKNPTYIPAGPAGERIHLSAQAQYRRKRVKTVKQYNSKGKNKIDRRRCSKRVKGI